MEKHKTRLRRWENEGAAACVVLLRNAGLSRAKPGTPELCPRRSAAAQEHVGRGPFAESGSVTPRGAPQQPDEKGRRGPRALLCSEQRCARIRRQTPQHRADPKGCSSQCSWEKPPPLLRPENVTLSFSPSHGQPPPPERQGNSGEGLPSKGANNPEVPSDTNRALPRRGCRGLERSARPCPLKAAPSHLQADFMMEQKRQSIVQPSAREHPQSALASRAAFQSIIYNT